MYKVLDEVFYIDIFDGIIKEGEFLEYENDGVWLRIVGERENIFVYSDLVDERVYKKRDEAKAGLVRIRTEMKARLLRNNLFINDICNKLEQHEGKLYIGIIKEILQEKIMGGF